MNLDMTTSAKLNPVSSPNVLIVILNWNSVDETSHAVRAALKTDYPSFSILVIDNGSDPETHDAVRSLKQDRVEVVFLDTNRGFTGGSNFGLKFGLERKYDYVWLFNSDASTAPETLASLVRTAQGRERVGLVSPRIVASQDPSRDLFTGGLYEPHIPSIMHTSQPALIHKWALESPTQLVLAGTALLVATELVRQIGYLDDIFFAYWEDMDYSVRSLKAGFRNLIDFGSAVEHFDKFCGPRPFDLKPHWRYYMMRNQIIFWRKHAPGKQKLKTMVWSFRDLLSELRAIHQDPMAQRALCAGAWDGYLKRGGAYTTARHMPKPVASFVVMLSRRQRK